MGKEKMLTLELPPEVVKGIDSVPISLRLHGHRSRVCRFLLKKGLEKYINFKTMELLSDLRLERGMTYEFPSRIGFVISEEMDMALEELCKVYPFSRKGLAEFLLCQVYVEQDWKAEYRRKESE